MLLKDHLPFLMITGLGETISHLELTTIVMWRKSLSRVAIYSLLARWLTIKACHDRICRFLTGPFLCGREAQPHVITPFLSDKVLNTDLCTMVLVQWIMNVTFFSFSLCETNCCNFLVWMSCPRKLQLDNSCWGGSRHLQQGGHSFGGRT